MSEGLDLGGGEESPPMPEPPEFLRRWKGGETSAGEGSLVEPTGELRLTHVALVDNPPDPNCIIGEPVPPSHRDLVDLLDKLVAKRDKLEASIVEIKKQLIEQVRTL